MPHSYRLFTSCAFDAHPKMPFTFDAFELEFGLTTLAIVNIYLFVTSFVYLWVRILIAISYENVTIKRYQTLRQTNL